MKIKFTKRAQRRVKFVGTWWREHRPAAPNLFADELEWATREMLSRLDLATPYETAGGKVFRRLLLRTTQQHVYYTVHKDDDLVIVRTIWGARRGRGPNL